MAFLNAFTHAGVSVPLVKLVGVVVSNNHNKAAVVQKQQASDDVVDQQARTKDVARDVQKK